MIFDVQDKAKTIIKVIGYITLVWLFFIVHITIILLAHSAIGAIQHGISMDEAITPFYSHFMNNDFIGAFNIIRETTFSEIPFYSYLNALFGQKATISLSGLFYDLTKVSIAGIICYLLCRLNFLFSLMKKDENYNSKKSKTSFLFAVILSFWISISNYSSLIFVEWIKDPDAHISNVILLAVTTTIFAVAIISFITFVNLRSKGIPICISRISKMYLFDFLGSSLLDGVFIYLSSCFSFDILRHFISDDISLIMLTVLIGLFLLLIYSHFKNLIFSH